ncbi:MAG: UDP-glucose 6-dehydrogenase [Bdellovibrionaceae bacterium]|nr:UDP-glucose 6-dehydrogenase [Pseudobdellovibrionaceae bacterium]|tara:strand:- start:1404 stop:2699 length:1296 start_codon:yes stop_codon:yes gene_type:complete
MKIAVIGTGYVGLVAGTCFADNGNDVICVDQDPTKVERLKKGIIPIYEPGLEKLVLRNVESGRISFTTETAEAVKKSDIVFLAVGTPPLPSGDPDLSYLESAARSVGRAINGFKVIVNKSTVPIGTHQTVAQWLSEETDELFEVVSNPEFLKEGTAVDDFLKPDRVVIGTRSDRAFEMMEELYGPFCRQGNPIIRMDPVSSEMTKYACNAFLATRISFMNEIAQLCDLLGGDVEHIRKGMGSDVRIGKHFLYAGAGYGGSCFPKDVQALMAKGREVENPLKIVTATEEVNHAQKTYLFKKIKNHYKGEISGKKFAIWGAAFKPNTDDMREAPAIEMIRSLLKDGASVSVYDPVALDNTRQIFEDAVTYGKNASDTLRDADALVLMTEWNEFRHVDFNEMKLNDQVIFDGRNIYSPEKVKKSGMTYYGIGRS